LFSETEGLLLSTFGAAVIELREHIAAFNYPLALTALKTLLAARPNTPAPASEQAGANSPINLDALNKVFEGKTERGLVYLRKFPTHAEVNVAEINAAREARAADKIIFHAHRFKSSARMVGAESLGSICQRLEAAGREEDWAIIDALCAEMARSMEEIRAFIDEIE
jgi:HPt (histidine-containing phosphotransfer) domain-containing protein